LRVEWCRSLVGEQAPPVADEGAGERDTLCDRPRGLRPGGGCGEIGEPTRSITESTTAVDLATGAAQPSSMFSAR